MPGSPIRRTRRGGIRLADGTVIAFPKLTDPRTGLSHSEWRALSPDEKLERLFGMSLERVAEILCWGPLHELDPVRLNAVVTIIRVVLLISARAGLFERALREGEFREAEERFRRAMEQTGAAAMRHNACTGKSRAPLGGGLEKLGHPRKSRPIFRGSQPRRCGTVVCSRLSEPRPYVGIQQEQRSLPLILDRPCGSGPVITCNLE